MTNVMFHYLQAERMGGLVCDYIAPPLALALKYPVSDPDVEFVPSSLLSLVSFSCMHIIHKL